MNKYQEAYKIATTIVGYTPEEVEEAKAILLKSLDRLEQLEIANKNNEGLVRENVELINRNLELKKDYDLLDEDYDQLFAKFLKSEKENQELKEQVDYYKKEMESEQDFRESIQNYLMKCMKAIKLLKENLGIEIKHCVYDKDDGGVADDWFIDCAVFNESLTEEEYELLKEVLINE